jgi:uncharacterized protein (DUF58 family)
MAELEDPPELASYRARLARATSEERQDALAVLAVQRARIQAELAKLQVLLVDLEAELTTVDAMEKAHRETMN